MERAVSIFGAVEKATIKSLGEGLLSFVLGVERVCRELKGVEKEEFAWKNRKKRTVNVSSADMDAKTGVLFEERGWEGESYLLFSGELVLAIMRKCPIGLHTEWRCVIRCGKAVEDSRGIRRRDRDSVRKVAVIG